MTSPQRRALERQFDLVMVLLNATRPVSRAVLRGSIPGYSQDSEPAFERMFERDKEGLRGLGIPVETRPIDTGFHDEVGYWIDKRTALLPPIPLTPGERGLVTLAGRLWRDTQLGVPAQIAARRLGNVTGGDELPDVRLAATQPDIATVFDAIHSGVVVEFRYAAKHTGQVELRRVEPWRLFCTAGAWYLVGHDLERDAERVFRLSRVAGGLVATDHPVTRSAPTDLDVTRLVAAWHTLASEPVTAVLEVDPGTCAHLRAQAVTATPGSSGEVLTISAEYLPTLARDIAAVCGNVTVHEPAELRILVAQMVRDANG